jgi:hypothetical protein
MSKASCNNTCRSPRLCLRSAVAMAGRKALKQRAFAVGPEPGVRDVIAVSLEEEAPFQPSAARAVQSDGPVLPRRR